MKYTLDLATQKVFGPYETDESTAPSMSLGDYVDKVKDKYPFSSGLMPLNGTGVLSIQRGFGFEQIIYQLVPAIENISWGERESTQNKKIFNLAVPYRIYIIDFKDGNLVGCRHFFSPEPIYNWEQKLYIPNLPNTNCIGYNGTSVGWVCLYHRHDTTKYTFAERIEYALNRMSGLVEPYNNVNMSETDGVRFYQHHKAPAFMYDANAWHKKSVDEGFQWTLDPDLLIPFRVPVDPKDHAQSHVDGENVPFYTLHRAANEPYSAHYGDKTYSKPWMITDHNETPKELLMSAVMGTAAPAAKALKEKPKKPETPEELLKYFSQDMPGIKMQDQEKILKILTGVRTYLCERCGQHQPHIYTVVDNITEYDGLNVQDYTASNWCASCKDHYAKPKYTKYMININGEIIPDFSHPDQKKIAVSMNALVDLGDSNLSYYSHITECSNCGYYHHKNFADERIVYGMINDQLSKQGCIKCIGTASFAKDFHTNKMMLKDFMTETVVSNLEINAETNAPTFVQSTVWTTKPITYCACKLVALQQQYAADATNEQGGLGNICGGCLKYDPITLETIHVPMINLADLPLNPII
jgi:hypothetical protein